MNITQITQTLTKIFFDDNYRIVLWNDAESEFLETVSEIVPQDVELVRLDETGALAAKIRLELEKPKQKFLVYAPVAQPPPEEDWLLDLRHYSRTFTADSASILLNDLGLQTQTLRDFLKTRKTFFAGKERLARLKRWIQPDDGTREINKKMLAVTVRAEQPETFTILLKVFTALVDEAEKEDAELQDFAPVAWKEIEKYNLAEYFWQLAEETFGYTSTEPRLYDLLVQIFVTDFAANARQSLPNQMKSLVLANRSGAYNAAVILAGWRTNTAFQEHYRRISARIEIEIKARDWISDIPAQNLNECETFEIVERRIIGELRDCLLTPLPSETSDWQNLMNARRDKFWCRGAANSYLAVYDALAAALSFYRLRDEYSDEGFNFTNAAAAFRAYRDELFRFDQFYRIFQESSQAVKFEGWNIFKSLPEEIENTYGNWFLENLAIGWGKCVEHERLFENWQIDDVANQYKFFRKHVKPLAAESSDRKIYVIISDAFRYECAEELTGEMNKEARKSGKALLEAELSAMLGVVPSYTALGKAVLLPHETIDYKTTKPNADILYTDGFSSAGMTNRNAVMNKFNGLATTFEDFIKLGKDAGRERVRDYQIIYIYHDLIDSTGDTASSESETFKAVRQTIGELSQTVNYIFNSLNGSQIFITADHGFLFQENAPQELDKSSLEIKSDEVLKRKKRYVINPQIAPQQNAWHGRIGSTSGIAGEMEFLIPKGANRFHFSGGARFVHGGAMPQEICVPVITVRKLRGQAAIKSAVSRVGVTLLGNLTRIVNNVQRFEFIQTETVSERSLPRTLHVSLRDDADKIISNETVITFDSRSDSMDERRKTARLTLRAGNYERTRQYYLVLIDNDAIVKEFSRLPVTIDIAFSSDF